MAGKQTIDNRYQMEKKKKRAVRRGGALLAGVLEMGESAKSLLLIVEGLEMTKSRIRGKYGRGRKAPVRARLRHSLVDEGKEEDSLLNKKMGIQACCK